MGCLSITFLAAKKSFRADTHGGHGPEKLCYGFIGPAMRDSYPVEAMRSSQITLVNKLGIIISTQYPNDNIETNNALPLETRRSAVLQKLVASGNTTAEMIRGLAETITGYEAKVEVNDDYSFSLSFWGEKNQLADIDVEELKTIVEQIKPAHLRFVITGITWADLESVNMTWGYFDENPTTWAQLETMLCVHAKE